jgi:ubiquitin-protein ligase
MSDININCLNNIITDLINKCLINNTTTIKSCDDDDNNYNVKIELNSNIITILSDFTYYCYIESNIYTLYELNEINEYIFYNEYYKNFKDIIVSISNFNIRKKVFKTIKYNDTFNFYNKIEEKTKIFIDYKLLELESKNILNMYNNVKIKNSLNINKIYNLILNEVKKINTNYDYSHFVVPINNNIFNLEINLFLKNVTIKLEVNLDPKLYPYRPPSIKIISPQVKLSLYFAIMNLNVTKLANWHSAISLEWIITNLSNKLELVIDDYINTNNEYSDLDLYISKLSNVMNENYDSKLNINLEINKFIKEKNNHWKSGIGYGSGSCNNIEWNINDYIKEKELQNLEIVDYLKNINNLLNDDNIKNINNTYLLSYILNFTNGINLLEIEKNIDIFNEIINILFKIYNYVNNDFIINITNNLSHINDFYPNIENIISENAINEKINTIYQIFFNKIKRNEFILDENIVNNNIEEYNTTMKPLQFKLDELFENHYFYSNKDIIVEKTTFKRIISEISSLKTGIPLNYDSSIWIRIPKNNMNIFTFLISGPKDTPYENGLFEFHTFLPASYPHQVPKVLLKTTGNNTVRFNPNLYNCGKVCLSLLGTWQGDVNESWNPNTSTFLQVLISIQSLILVEDPYFNEPGYEKEINTPRGNLNNKKYNNNTYINTLKWAIINQIKNPPKGYEDVVKEHFRIKKDDIINKINMLISNSDESVKLQLTTELNNFINLFNI